MRVQERETFFADEPSQPPCRPQIEAPSHWEFIEWRDRTASLGKAIRLQADEGRFNAEFRQPQGQEILHPLGPGEMLAVDHMQHSQRPPAPPPLLKISLRRWQ